MLPPSTPFPAVLSGFRQEPQSVPSRSAVPKKGSDDLRNAANTWSARIAEYNKATTGRWSTLYLATPDKYPPNNNQQQQPQRRSTQILRWANESVDAALQDHLEKLTTANDMRTATIDPWERLVEDAAA